MLAKRTLLMTGTGLLMGYLAAGQPAAAAPAPTGSDMLFWLLLGILGIVLLVVLVTGASVAMAVRRPRESASTDTETTPQAEEGAVVC